MRKRRNWWILRAARFVWYFILRIRCTLTSRGHDFRPLRKRDPRSKLRCVRCKMPFEKERS